MRKNKVLTWFLSWKEFLFHRSCWICNGNDAHDFVFSIQRLAKNVVKVMTNAVDFPEIIQKSTYFKSFFRLYLSKSNYVASISPSFKFNHMKDQFKWFHFFRFRSEFTLTFNEICAFVWCYKHRVWIKAINVKKLFSTPKHFSQIKYGVVLTNKINASNSRNFWNEPRKQPSSSQYFRKKKKEIMHIHTCGVVEERMREILNNINIERGNGVSVCYWLRNHFNEPRFYTSYYYILIIQCL